MKILLIQYGKVEDILLSSAIANNLKKIYPDAIIDFLCLKKYMGVLQKNPNIHRIITLHSKKIYSPVFLYKYIKLIQSENYDALINLTNNFSSFLITLFSKAKKKYSYSDAMFKKIYSYTVQKVKTPITQTCNILENKLQFLEPFLKDNPIPVDPLARIYLTEEEIQYSRTTMLNAGIKFTRPVIMLGILGSNKYNTWTISSMAKLIDYVWENYRADLLLNYLPSQYKQVNELLSLLNSNTKVFAQPVGKGLREYAGLMHNCTLFIGNYGKSMLIAKALKKPTFTIYPPYINKKDVACYENTNLHQSVQLEDFLPYLFNDFYLSELYKSSSKFYLMLPNDLIINNNLKPFLQEYLA